MPKTPGVATVMCLAVLLAASPMLAVQTEGKVIDSGAAGKALAKVEFTVPGEGDEVTVVATAWTDDYGSFGADVEPGTYTVVISDGDEDGPVTAVADVSVAEDGTLAPAVLEVDW